MTTLTIKEAAILAHLSHRIKGQKGFTEAQQKDRTIVFNRLGDQAKEICRRYGFCPKGKYETDLLRAS